MLFAIAATLAAAQPAAPGPAPSLGGTAWIVATVGQSEWCPAGNVRLDLRTGRYQFTARAPRRVCNERGLERPVSVGTLRAGRLESVRAAYLRALSEGLENPACREGGHPQEIVVDNGGPRILVLANGSATGSPPDELTCWSRAAFALHEELERQFPSDPARPRRALAQGSRP
jgi:hypothetical protein